MLWIGKRKGKKMSQPRQSKQSRAKKAEHTLRKGDVATTALIAVDVQRDFYHPQGALAVQHGEEVIAPLVKLAEEVGYVVATRDYHPANHCSFVEQGGQWPEHCVARKAEPTTMDEAAVEYGSDLHPEVEKHASIVVSKGCDADVEAYSAFDGTGLAATLKERGIATVIVGGLATDYCVKATALDATKEGFQAIVVKSACRAVNVHARDEDRAYGELLAAGVTLWETF